MLRACLRHRLFLCFWLVAGLMALTAAACGDDEPDTAPGSGGGGEGGSDGGGQIGGFNQGLGGSSGGEDNEGGTGELSYVWGDVKGGVGSVVTRDVAIDNAGNIIVVGAFTGGPINFGGADLTSAGGNDIFVAKFDDSGNHVFSDRYGGGNDEGALAVATDAGNNIILTGNFKSNFSIGTGTTSPLTNPDPQFPNVYVAKLDGNGAHIASATYGIGNGHDDSGNAIASDASDNIVFAGRFQTSIDFGGGTINASGGAGDRSLFLAKLSGGFNHLYSQGFGDTEFQEAFAVAGGPNGAMAVGGDTNGGMNFGGGNLPHPATGFPRATVARFDGAGQHLFSHVFAGDGNARVVGLAFHDNGDLIAAGNFKSSIDVGNGVLEAEGAVDDLFLVRYDSAGSVVYSRRFGDQARDTVADVALDSQGYAYMVGSFAGDLRVNFMSTLSTSASVQDAFLLVAGPGTGNGYAGVATSGTISAEGAGVAVDPNDDSIVVVGSASGEIDLGGGPETANADMFIAKFTR